MALRFRHLDLRPRMVAYRVGQRLQYNRNWQFARDVARMIWEYRTYSLTITVVTIFQEVAALWPVALLGRFVDGLATGDLGNVVWLFFGASVLYPGIVRANVMLRHKMFYETDFRKRVEMTLKVADRGECEEIESAAAAHTRVLNAVSGITNAAYHVLGSFTPVIIKVIVVSGSLLAYNRMLGLTYLASLLVPAAMTATFNNRLRVLRDAEYTIMSQGSGVGVKVIANRGDSSIRDKYVGVMRERTNVLIALVCKSQTFLYIREAALVGSQFLVVFMALAMRDRLQMTPGDFTRVVGYTTQVATAFINTAAVLDAIISYSRAYHVYAEAHDRAC
jgi:hypothetical protein